MKFSQPMSLHDRRHRNERLRQIPYEIGKAHISRDPREKARLFKEKAEHLAALHASSTGEHILVADAQKEAAEHLANIGDKHEALDMYRRALGNLAATVAFRAGTRSRVAEDKEQSIQRLQGILKAAPDPKKRAHREELLRAQGLLMPGEALDYEVDVENVQKEIDRLKKEKRGAEAEDEFQQKELSRMRDDLSTFRSRIRHLEKELGLEHGKIE